MGIGCLNNCFYHFLSIGTIFNPFFGCMPDKTGGRAFGSGFGNGCKTLKNA
jgi:hypothetical protein